jgi:hypothetical protein
VPVTAVCAVCHRVPWAYIVIVLWLLLRTPDDGQPSARRVLLTRPQAAELLRGVVAQEVERRLDQQLRLQAAALQGLPAPRGGSDSEAATVSGHFEVEVSKAKQPMARPPSFNRQGKLGAWLSREDGSATWLSRCIYVALGFYAVAWLLFGIDGDGILNKLGCQRGSGMAQNSSTSSAIGDCDAGRAKSLASVVTHVSGFLCLSTSGLVAFHTMRLAHRPASAGGALAQLGAGQAMVSIAVARQLRRRAKWIKGVAVWLILQGSVGLLAVALLLPEIPLWMRILLPVWVTCWTLCVWSMSAWFLSLMLGAALSAARVEAVAEAVRFLLDTLSRCGLLCPGDHCASRDCAVEQIAEASNSAVRLGDETWRRSIERPAVLLATEVLPLLSKGWGHSVALVGLGFVSFTTGFGALLFEASEEWFSGGVVGILSGVLCFALLLAFASLPVFLALAPADVSTRCDNLLESLTALRARDPCGEHMRIGALYDVLRLINKGHGLGFKVWGVVLNRRRLLEALGVFYTLLGTIVPRLL